MQHRERPRLTGELLRANQVVDGQYRKTETFLQQGIDKHSLRLECELAQRRVLVFEKLFEENMENMFGIVGQEIGELGSGSAADIHNHGALLALLDGFRFWVTPLRAGFGAGV